MEYEFTGPDGEEVAFSFSSPTEVAVLLPPNIALRRANAQENDTGDTDNLDLSNSKAKVLVIPYLFISCPYIVCRSGFLKVPIHNHPIPVIMKVKSERFANGRG